MTSCRTLSRAAYIVLGVSVEGYKDILSITVGANETSKFWLGMLNDLKNLHPTLRQYTEAHRSHSILSALVLLPKYSFQFRRFDGDPPDHAIDSDTGENT